MFCTHCGTQLDDNFNFCTKCGNRLTGGNPAPVNQQPQVNQPNTSNSEEILFEKTTAYSCKDELGGDSGIAGKLIITTKKITFKVSFINSLRDSYGNKIKEISILYDDIKRLEMGSNLLKPKIIIHCKQGNTEAFVPFSKGKEAFDLIEQQLKLKKGS